MLYRFVHVIDADDVQVTLLYRSIDVVDANDVQNRSFYPPERVCMGVVCNNRSSIKSLYEPPHDKTNKMICASSEDSDQPGYPPSLISLRCLHEETLDPQLPIERTVKTDHTGWMPRLI